jgi:DNA-binding LytR/AlgR family response regulator
MRMRIVSLAGVMLASAALLAGHTFEQSLDPAVFLRIHRSVLVNVRRIRDVEPALHGENVVQLHTGARFHTGRTYQAKIKSLIANPF